MKHMENKNTKVSKKRKQYIKPDFKSAMIYERLALGCNRKQGESFPCNLNPAS